VVHHQPLWATCEAAPTRKASVIGPALGDSADIRREAEAHWEKGDLDHDALPARLNAARTQVQTPLAPSAQGRSTDSAAGRPQKEQDLSRSPAGIGGEQFFGEDE
jgi:hypothetical protein